MIPFTCPCCEVSKPPHRGGCTFHADAAADAADFDEVSTLRAEITRLREERREVVLTEVLNHFDTYGDRVASFNPDEVRKALAAIGVKVKEVGRECADQHNN